MLSNFGRPVETVVSATTTVGTALAANSSRLGGFIQNQGIVVVQVSFTDPTAATSFYNLAAGATLPLTGIQGIVYVKAASSTASLYCLEIVG